MASLLPEAFPNHPPGAWTALWCAGRGDASLPRKASGKCRERRKCGCPAPTCSQNHPGQPLGMEHPELPGGGERELKPLPGRPGQRLWTPILRGKRKPNQGHTSFPRARPQRRAPFSRAPSPARASRRKQQSPRGDRRGELQPGPSNQSPWATRTLSLLHQTSREN